MDSRKTLTIILIGLAVVAIALGVLQYDRAKGVALRLDRPAPLPENIDTAFSASEELEPLLGVWEGTWARNNPELAMTTSLVITKIDENNVANVIYAWGNNEGVGITEGYLETLAQIDGNTIDVKMRKPVTLVFLVEDGELQGFFDNQYVSVSGILTKVDEQEDSSNEEE